MKPSVQAAGQTIRTSASVCAVHTGSAGIIYGVYLMVGRGGGGGGGNE